MVFNPFYSYARFAKFGFGTTFATNLVVSNLTNNPPINMEEYPLRFISCLLLKSATCGILWPAIPLQLYRDIDSYSIVGKGPERLLKQDPGKELELDWKTYIDEVKESTKWKITE